MSSSQAETKIKAAAWSAAADLGMSEAIKLLQKIARELENSLWEGPGNQ
jgi:hypothetical protein